MYAVKTGSKSSYNIICFNHNPDCCAPDFDDTSVNKMEMKCRGPGLYGSTRQTYLAYGQDWGTWGSYSSECPYGSAICAIQASFEPTGSGDESALNDLDFYCCHY